MTAKKKAIKKSKKRTSARPGLSFKFGNASTEQKAKIQNAFVDSVGTKDRKPADVTEAFITEIFEKKFQAVIQHYEYYGNSFSK